MDFFNYIHAVGTGAKGNRDLSFDESKDMMTQILNQNIPPEQISAFLLGWRLKPETTTEFRGAIEACTNYTKKTPIKNSLELGYPFDGKAKNPYIFPLVAKILQKYNLNLSMIGDKLTPAKAGITVKEICSQIELPSNLYYFKREDFIPKLSELTELRIKLGLRCGLNTIEKLPNITNSDFAITGVFHKPYVQKYIDIFAHRYKKFALIQGNEGTPELFSKGRLWIHQDQQTNELRIDPAHYGITYKKSWDKISLNDSIEQLKNPSNEYLKLAKLNAAIYLFITDNSTTIDEAWEKLN